jgi:hypothetical protein
MAVGISAPAAARVIAPNGGAWFGLSKQDSVAFRVAGARISHFMVTGPDGVVDRPLCSASPVVDASAPPAQIRRGRIVSYGHYGLAGNISGKHAHGTFSAFGCTLHWSATFVHRKVTAGDGNWTGSLSNGSAVSFVVASAGEMIRPPSNGAMFAGAYGSCDGFNFGGALIWPDGTFKLRLSDAPGGATSAGAFTGSQAAAGTLQGNGACATSQLSWSAQR